MAHKTSDKKFSCTVKLKSETIKIPYLPETVSTKIICPVCQRQKKTNQVFIILKNQIKDEHRCLLTDDDFERIKKIINKKLRGKTLVCMHCAGGIANLE